MAQHVIIAKIDDIDGAPAGKTVLFGLDGRCYEIDLSEANEDALRSIYALYIAKARKVGTRRGRRSSTGGRRGALGRERAADMRAWAQRHGIKVSQRGRIPAQVVDAYEAGDPAMARTR
ncbi:Lsr2 family protein [Actinomadura darangshiensis]|uniref:Lsr2 family protein n=1 Tax=Actinomadura darangshiensis TaxID=705336 RepID=A0A4R4ZQV1_9ACTN|nr:Lsr2 family protein [Actinomadura darangshiensis]TDD61323.1 Lsr2 family protein [Actinomadura darangshiensis]